MKNPFEQPVAQAPAENTPERKTTISRALMKNKEDEEKALEFFADLFENQEFYGFEREKTDDESEIIDAVNEKMKDFVERYGGIYTKITADHIHIIDQKKLSKSNWSRFRDEDGSMCDGLYIMEIQGALINLFRHDDLVKFAKVLSHELIHLQEYQTVHAQWQDDEKSKLHYHRRRDGMRIFGMQDKEGGYGYFEMLNEAVTEELARRFAVENFADIPALEAGMNFRDETYPGFDETERISGTFVRELHKRGYEGMSKWGTADVYLEERQFLNKLIDQIYEKSSEQFASREDVFAVFAKAHFTGHLLPLARLIEKTMGKGYLRKLAEEQKMTYPEDHFIVKQNRVKEE
ncbi:MAG: hypothetical protein WC819_03545 [Parcubacteria group bacterium]|jgi:hypothetical protein